MRRFLIRINDSPDVDLLMSSGEFVIKHKDEYFVVGNHLIEIINDLDLYIVSDKSICIEITGYDTIDSHYLGRIKKLKVKEDEKNNNG